jgi:undecaprenyl-diphosphatase
MMRYVTHLGGATFTTLVSVLLLLSDDFRVVGLLTAAANAFSHVAVQVLKRTVVRARPLDANGNSVALVAVPDPYSFPSGHSSAAFALAIPIALSYPLLAPPLLSLATLIAASRVTLKVHHLSDVIVGAALGAAAGISVFLIGT